MTTALFSSCCQNKTDEKDRQLNEQKLEIVLEPNPKGGLTTVHIQPFSRYDEDPLSDFCYVTFSQSKINGVLMLNFRPNYDPPKCEPVILILRPTISTKIPPFYVQKGRKALSNALAGERFYDSILDCVSLASRFKMSLECGYNLGEDETLHRPFNIIWITKSRVAKVMKRGDILNLSDLLNRDEVNVIIACDPFLGVQIRSGITQSEIIRMKRNGPNRFSYRVR